MSKLVTVVVTAELPKDVTPKDFRDYVLEEVKANIGSLNPADPMFHLNRESVQVTTLYGNSLIKNLCLAIEAYKSRDTSSMDSVHKDLAFIQSAVKPLPSGRGYKARRAASALAS